MKQTKYSRCAVVGWPDLYITFQPQKTQAKWIEFIFEGNVPE